MRLRSAAANCAGNVITECALVIPFLFTVFTGIVELGRLQSQITWVANNAYEVALTGGETPQSVGDLSMQSRHDQIKSIPYYHLSSQPTAAWQYHTTGGGFPDNSVSVTVSANLPFLLSTLVGPFSVQSVGPILVLGNGVPGNLSQFANPAELYDCNGVKIPGCTGAHCACTQCLPTPSC